LVTIFSAIAAIPVVLTAGAAGVLMNLAMEAWFNAPIQSVVASSVAVTNTYFDEHTEKLKKEIGFAAANLNELTTLDFATARFQKYVEAIADRLNAEVKVFTRRGQEIAAAGGGLTARVEVPTEEDFERAGRGETFVRVDDDRSQLRAMNKLSVQEEQDVDLFLVVARDVNPTILEFLQNSKKASDDYRRLEEDRNEVLATFSLIFGLIAFVILFAAIWLGLGTANRIVTPIGRLIGAAERISEGDLGARVMLARDDDELATLGKAFNRMSAQLQSQRNELIESHRQTEQRRRFTEAVLSGVSAGVIGLDGQGRADVANRSAFTLLSANRDDIIGRPLVAAIPEVEELIQKAMASLDGRGQSHVDITRSGKTRNFTVTVTRERAGEDESGYVVTFDDITDLITAQRTSAWADVARRIAHEIKNPLTPIQLSAERLRRKYKKEIASDPEIFEQCTQTIIRQVGDIGRMVDEFSSFARMPQPVMRDEDISELIKHSVFLQRVAHPQITYALLVPDTPVMVECDGRLVSQALTNVLKNASEAVRAAFGLEGEEGQLREGGRIEIRLVEENQRLSIEVIDNGIGLPKEDRNRLTEPYVTKRAKGTGLGLAIVRKIMEDHKGALSLEDAPKIDETGATRESGAMVRLTFLRRLSAVKLAGE
jgi:two-component system nitrogen regulation sensor histidine kinase NtrY